MSDPARILVIDDDADARALVALVIAARLPGAQVCPVAGALDYAEQLADGRWSVAVVEPQLSWADGLALVASLCGRHPERAVVVFAGRDSSADAVRAITAGARDFLPKTPAGTVGLAEALAAALPRLAANALPGAGPQASTAAGVATAAAGPVEHRAGPGAAAGPAAGASGLDPAGVAAARAPYGERWRALASQARERGYGDFEARALENAVEADPGDDDAFERLVELHVAGERWAEAIALLQARVRDCADISRMRALYKRLISLHTDKLGKAEAGLQTYMQWRRRDPENGELRRVLLELLRRLKRWPTLALVLRELSEEAAEPAVQSRWLLELAGVLDTELGQRAQAATVLEEAAARLPGDVEVIRRLAAIRGDAPEAPTEAPLPTRSASRDQTWHGPLPEPADRVAKGSGAASAGAERMTRPFRVAGGRRGAVLELVAGGEPADSDEALEFGEIDGEGPAARDRGAFGADQAGGAEPGPTSPSAPGRPLAMIAHDLQEPARSVANYLTVLRSRHGEALDADAIELIERATGAARRMQDRVQGLMAPEAAASARAPAPAEPVDCTEVVARTLEDLEDAISRSGARVTLGQLPSVPADPAALGQLFQNLISNAIKYRSDAPPRVRISAREKPEHWQFTVSDNGVGVPEADRERVFEMFQRGADVGAVPGTGIGLALCRKTVAALGGRIWLEPGATQGTRVHFTIARPQRAVG